MRKSSLIIIAVLIPCVVCSAELISVDADGFAEGTDISLAFNGITLSSVGGYSGLDGKVYAFGDGLASTGTQVFGNNLSFQRQWYANLQDGFALRADFLQSADSVSIDIIGDDYSGKDIGVLFAYNAADTLLDTVVTGQLGYGDVFSAQIIRPSFDIAYIVAGGLNEDTVHLDNLSANVVPEPATIMLLAIGTTALIRNKNFGKRKGLP